MHEDNCYVGDSGITGQGVFARRLIQAGERILKLDDSRRITPDNPLRGDLGESEDHVDHLAGGVLIYMREPERYLNHSCRPNAYCRHFDGIRYLIARRAIQPGEEIVVDYAVNSAVKGHSWQCGCAAPDCRGEANLDFFSLPPAKQLEYLAMLDAWFIEENRQRLSHLMDSG